MRSSARRIAMEEEVRRRLARTLHDDHGQRATALGFELRAVRNQLAEGTPPRDQIEAVARHLGSLAEDLRRLSHDLHPALLERRGLVEALHDTCSEIEGRHGLQCQLVSREIDDPIPPEVALALYRIAQEGLTNAVRHAATHTVRLTLGAVGGTVQLSLVDDGKGFDTDAVSTADGLGLASMEERARALGGRCRILSTPGMGTRIEARIPRRRFSRWVRRRWGWITAVSLVVLALSGGLIATLVQARQTAVEARHAEATVRFLEGLFVAADPHQARGHLPDARDLLLRGSERLQEDLRDQPLLRARLLDTLGGIHTELGLYDQARPLLEEALNLRKMLRGPKHPEVAATLVRLGSLAHLSGEGDAVALFLRALATYEQEGSQRKPALADLLNKLGAAHGARGHFDEAEAALRRSLALHERLFGPQDPRVAKLLHNLSGVAYYRQEPEVAEALIVRALAIREAALPEDDPDLAGSREVLGLLRRDQGRLREAMGLFEQVAATTERIYGPEHPELARTLVNLAMTHAGLGEDEIARDLFERALAIQEAALAPEHPSLVRTLFALAEHHRKQGRVAETEALYRRLLELHSQGVEWEGWDRVLARWETLQSAATEP